MLNSIRIAPASRVTSRTRWRLPAWLPQYFEGMRRMEDRQRQRQALLENIGNARPQGFGPQGALVGQPPQRVAADHADHEEDEPDAEARGFESAYSRRSRPWTTWSIAPAARHMCPR